MAKQIYLDHAGTTPMDPRVERVVLKHLHETWGNASSVHGAGRQAKKVIDDAHKSVARVLSVRPEEIIFTGSGTESDNLAVFGIARAYKKYGKHVIVSKIEHPAVLMACRYLEKNEGFKITHLGVEKNGIINPEAVKKSLRRDTVLVSIMYANNEIGTIQPIAAISKILKDFRNSRRLQVTGYRLQMSEKTLFFHTDACQAAGAFDLNVNRLGIDLMTLNGSKIYGPKATGCLYVRRGIELVPLIVGGSQERGRRAGTENPALIAGFAKALELADGSRTKESQRLSGLRDYMIGQILKNIPGSRLNGDPSQRLPNNINISFEGVDPERGREGTQRASASYGVDGEMLMLALDQEGIMVSTGSACTSTETRPSHVLLALQGPTLHKVRPYGFSLPRSNLGKAGNLRITLGRQTTKKDIDHVLVILPKIVNRLRH